MKKFEEDAQDEASVNSKAVSGPAVGSKLAPASSTNVNQIARTGLGSAKAAAGSLKSGHPDATGLTI